MCAVCVLCVLCVYVCVYIVCVRGKPYIALEIFKNNEICCSNRTEPITS